MILSIIKKTILLFLPIFILTACIPKDVEVYQQEDELLNCIKLTGKLAELMNTNNEINENTGLEDRSLFLWYLSPLGGVINQVQASEGRDKVDERFDYLVKLKHRQGCGFTDKEIAFSKLQGKGRFYEDLEKWNNDLEKLREEYRNKQIGLK